MLAHKSFCLGEFQLSSGSTSDYYIDCRVTTLDARGAQLMFSWGPVLVIFLVGIVLTIVRAKTNSVAAGVLIHMAYNGTITVAMFAATDGFRHLEKLNQ